VEAIVATARRTPAEAATEATAVVAGIRLEAVAEAIHPEVEAVVDILPVAEAAIRRAVTAKSADLFVALS